MAHFLWFWAKNLIAFYLLPISSLALNHPIDLHLDQNSILIFYQKMNILPNLTRCHDKFVITSYNDNPTRMMVGFNRRFAPTIQEIKKKLQNNKYPLSMYYRINGGFIPSGTWIQDAESGGGRIIGEVCHFVDLLSYITESSICKVEAESLAMPDEKYRSDDNLQITLRFENGSVGTINYVASGNTMLSKEYLEIFGGGMAITMDDFRTLTIADNKNTKLDKKQSQDKGHNAMLHAFCESLKSQSASPIPFADIVNGTEATFAILQSLSEGGAICLKD